MDYRDLRSALGYVGPLVQILDKGPIVICQSQIRNTYSLNVSGNVIIVIDAYPWIIGNSSYHLEMLITDKDLELIECIGICNHSYR